MPATATTPTTATTETPVPDTPSDLIGKTDAEIYPAREAVPLMVMKRRVIETGVTERAEVSLTLAGVRRVYDVVIEPLRNRDGVCCRY